MRGLLRMRAARICVRGRSRKACKNAPASSCRRSALPTQAYRHSLGTCTLHLTLSGRPLEFVLNSHAPSTAAPRRRCCCTCTSSIATLNPPPPPLPQGGQVVSVLNAHVPAAAAPPPAPLRPEPLGRQLPRRLAFMVERPEDKAAAINARIEAGRARLGEALGEGMLANVAAVGQPVQVGDRAWCCGVIVDRMRRFAGKQGRRAAFAGEVTRCLVFSVCVMKRQSVAGACVRMVSLPLCCVPLTCMVEHYCAKARTRSTTNNLRTSHVRHRGPRCSC